MGGKHQMGESYALVSVSVEPKGRDRFQKRTIYGLVVIGFTC